ncbi:MAG TPA: SsrA-binding protein, partial [Microbacteriaceae bacterium]|nr:SsrA-binding protein [Microbacteriaceae bacterium]
PPRRKRKLLLHKSEIVKISHAISAGGYTLVPLKLYFKDGYAKVEIAIAKGKREYDKRQTLRERQDMRDAERAMRTRNRMNE